MEVNLNPSYNSKFGCVLYINWSLIYNVINKLCCHPQALRKRCAFYTQQGDSKGSFSCDCVGTVYGVVEYIKGTHTISNVLRLGYLKDSNAAAHSVDTGIS